MKWNEERESNFRTIRIIFDKYAWINVYWKQSHKRDNRNMRVFFFPSSVMNYSRAWSSPAIELNFERPRAVSNFRLLPIESIKRRRSKLNIVRGSRETNNFVQRVSEHAILVIIYLLICLIHLPIDLCKFLVATSRHMYYSYC